MAARRLPPRTKARLLALVSDDRPDAERLLRRVRAIRSTEGVPAFAEVLHALAHLETSDGQAERILEAILAHRTELGRALGRDAGLRVSAVDYLSNIERRLSSPTVVERARLERTERSALTDPLTGLRNRRFFDEELGRELRRSRRFPSELSVLMLDVDHFNEVNDRHGHPFGDGVLRRVARVVRRAVRDSDSACRYGGDEIAVLFPDTSSAGAVAVAERIRTEIAAASGGVSGNVRLSVSGGIATHPRDGADAAALLARADAALYRAKAEGRDRIVLSQPERRRFPRWPPAARVQVLVDVPPLADPAALVDLGSGGLLLETSSGVEPAGAVLVRLDAGGDAGVSPPLPGRVVHARQIGQRPGWRIGIAFDRPVRRDLLRRHARTDSVGERA